jgi:hypothetical protein
MGVEGFAAPTDGEARAPRPEAPAEAQVDALGEAEQVARRHQLAARVADLEVKAGEKEGEGERGGGEV